MAKQVPLKTWRITNGAKPSGWGVMTLTKAEEFLVISDGTIFDLAENWDITVQGTPKEGMTLKGTISVSIQNFNGFKIRVFGQELTKAILEDTVLVELVYDKDLTPYVTFGQLPDETSGGGTDPAIIGDRIYTEENYVTNEESITESIDALDINLADKVSSNNPTFTGVVTVEAALKINTTLISNIIGGTTNLTLFQKTVGNGAYIDYAILSTSNIAFKVGTLYIVWNNSNIDYADYCTKDLDVDASSIRLEAVNTGVYIVIRAVVTSGTYNIKLAIRYI